MKVKDLGSTYSVSVSEREIDDFNRRWPAWHYGWSNFDDAREMTISQAEKKYGRMVDAAHKAENRSATKNTPQEPSLKAKLLR